MAYTLYQLEQMDDIELLTYCENNIDDLVTSTTEIALIQRLRKQLDGEGGYMAMSEVKGLLADIDAQIPEEDFLADLIYDLHDLATSKLKKDELIARIQQFANALESRQQDLAGGFEFASSMINETINPKPTQSNVIYKGDTR